MDFSNTPKNLNIINSFVNGKLNFGSYEYVAKLRYALLKVRTNLVSVKEDMHVNVLENIETATDKIDTCHVIIKDVLNDG